MAGPATADLLCSDVLQIADWQSKLPRLLVHLQIHIRHGSKQPYLHCVESHKVVQPLVPDHCQKQHKEDDQGAKLAAEVDAGEGPCVAQQQGVSR